MTPPNVSLILVMVCFWATLWLVQRYLIRPVGATLAERQNRVASAEEEWSARNEEHLAAIARIESEIDEAAREAGQVRATLRQEAMDARQTAIETAKARAEARLVEAVDELDRNAEEARGELRNAARKLAHMLAERLLAREVRS
ncbi:MAG: ATP synthase F0 subunit B [Acidobacteriota bacterium]